MAYLVTGISVIPSTVVGAPNIFRYKTTDDIATVTASAYFNNLVLTHRPVADDLIYIVSSDSVGLYKLTISGEIVSAVALDVASGAVDLASLAPGITPSHVVKFAGEHTWTGGAATDSLTVTGALVSDILLTTIKTKPTEAAYLAASEISGADTVDLELSAANTSNDAVISYQILRVAS